MFFKEIKDKDLRNAYLRLRNLYFVVLVLLVALAAGYALAYNHLSESLKTKVANNSHILVAEEVNTLREEIEVLEGAVRETRLEIDERGEELYALQNEVDETVADVEDIFNTMSNATVKASNEKRALETRLSWIESQLANAKEQVHETATADPVTNDAEPARDILYLFDDLNPSWVDVQQDGDEFQIVVEESNEQGKVLAFSRIWISCNEMGFEVTREVEDYWYQQIPMPQDPPRELVGQYTNAPVITIYKSWYDIYAFATLNKDCELVWFVPDAYVASEWGIEEDWFFGDIATIPWADGDSNLVFETPFDR